MTGPLDGGRQLSLMLCAGAGNAPGQDLAALRHILAKLRSILVIDNAVLFSAEHADLLTSVHAAALPHAFASILISHSNFSS